MPVWPKDMGMTADIKVVTVPRADQVLLVSVCASDQFPQWAAGKTAVAKVISGLGDAAFSGPQGDVEPNVVAFRKGPRAIRVVSLLSPDQEGYVSQAELVELAEIIAARMP